MAIFSEEPLLIQGIQLAKDDHFLEALDIFERLTEEEPLNDVAWVAKGKVLNNLGRYMDAYKAFDSALKINPKNKGAMTNIVIATQHINNEIPMSDAPSPASITKEELPSLSAYKPNYLLFIWPFFGIFFAFGGFIGMIICALFSGIFIAIDANMIRAGRGKESETSSLVSWKPWEWFLLTALFLIVFYPLYLIKRRDIFKFNYYTTNLSERRGMSNSLGIFFLLIVLGIAFVLFIGVPMIIFV